MARVDIEPSAAPVRVVFNGEVVADSNRALVFMDASSIRWTQYLIG